MHITDVHAFVVTDLLNLNTEMDPEGVKDGDGMKMELFLLYRDRRFVLLMDTPLKSRPS